MFKYIIFIGLFTKCTASTENIYNIVYPSNDRVQELSEDFSSEGEILNDQNDGCGWADPEGLPEDMRVYREFPWIVSVVKDRKIEYKIETRDTLDLGVLIHPGVVLTTAYIPQGKITLGIVAGESNREHEQYREVDNYVTHEQFNRKNMDNNVVLLFLKETVILSAYVKLACLPRFQLVPAKTECFSIEKKIQFNNDAKIKLDKVANVTLYAHSKCQLILKSSMRNVTVQTHGTIMCARTESANSDRDSSSAGTESTTSDEDSSSASEDEEEDTCPYDEENVTRKAFFCPIKAGSKRYAVFGLSFKPWFCWQNENISSIVYLNIAHFRNWIDMKVGEDESRDISVYDGGI